MTLSLPSARRHRDALVDGYVSGNLSRGRVVKLLKTTLSSDCFLVSVKTCCVMGMDGCRVGHDAVLAERLRRTLKARVRKSVGSIPTDCKNHHFLPPAIIIIVAVRVSVKHPRIAQLAERETVDGYN
jgi:hypothetical protein